MRTHLAKFLVLVLGLIWLPRGTFGAEQADVGFQLASRPSGTWTRLTAKNHPHVSVSALMACGVGSRQPQARRPCRLALGAFSRFRRMAGTRRIRPKRIANRLLSHKVEEPGPDQSYQSVVSAGIQRSRRLDGQAHCFVVGLFEFGRDRLCGRKKTREAVFPGR